MSAHETVRAAKFRGQCGSRAVRRDTRGIDLDSEPRLSASPRQGRLTLITAGGAPMDANRHNNGLPCFADIWYSMSLPNLAGLKPLTAL